MVRQFVPLTYQESVAVLHHHFSLNYDSIKDVGVVSNVYNRYSIAILLHVADTIATFVLLDVNSTLLIAASVGFNSQVN